jgi:hypothetical protein
LTGDVGRSWSCLHFSIKNASDEGLYAYFTRLVELLP